MAGTGRTVRRSGREGGISHSLATVASQGLSDQRLPAGPTIVAERVRRPLKSGISKWACRQSSQRRAPSPPVSTHATACAPPLQARAPARAPVARGMRRCRGPDHSTAAATDRGHQCGRRWRRSADGAHRLGCVRGAVGGRQGPVGSRDGGGASDVRRERRRRTGFGRHRDHQRKWRRDGVVRISPQARARTPPSPAATRPSGACDTGRFQGAPHCGETPR